MRVGNSKLHVDGGEIHHPPDESAKPEIVFVTWKYHIPPLHGGGNDSATEWGNRGNKRRPADLASHSSKSESWGSR